MSSTLYSEVHDCSYIQNPNTIWGLSFKSGALAGQCIYSLCNTNYNDWIKKGSPDLSTESLKVGPGPEFLLFDHSKLQSFLWQNAKLHDAILEWQKQKWSKIYKRNMLSVMNSVLNEFADQEKLLPGNRKALKSATEELIDWCCENYCVDQECWCLAGMRSKHVVPVDINSVVLDTDTEKKKPVVKKKRTLSAQAKKDRAITRLINKLTKEGAIDKDLDKRLAEKYERPLDS